MFIFVVNELVNILVNKNKKSGKTVPVRAIHGNVKYTFHLLRKAGDFFYVESDKRGNILTCLRNYNKKNGLNIKISTRKTENGIAVIRQKDSKKPIN